MKGEARLRAGARRDLTEIIRRYAREAGLGVSRRFRAEAEATFNRLAGMPGMGTPYEAENPAFGGVRFFPLPFRFKKYLVFYRPMPGGIEVARVLHGSRDIPAILAGRFGQGEAEDRAVEDQSCPIRGRPTAVAGRVRRPTDDGHWRVTGWIRPGPF